MSCRTFCVCQWDDTGFFIWKFILTAELLLVVGHILWSNAKGHLDSTINIVEIFGYVCAQAGAEFSMSTALANPHSGCQLLCMYDLEMCHGVQDVGR